MCAAHCLCRVAAAVPGPVWAVFAPLAHSHHMPTRVHQAAAFQLCPPGTNVLIFLATQDMMVAGLSNLSHVVICGIIPVCPHYLFPPCGDPRPQDMAPQACWPVPGVAGVASSAVSGGLAEAGAAVVTSARLLGWPEQSGGRWANRTAVDGTRAEWADPWDQAEALW